LIVYLSATVTALNGSIKRGLKSMEIEKILHTQHFGPEPEPKARPGEIAQLAYIYWEERQKNHVAGSDLDDWLRGEQQLTRSGSMRSGRGV
jgi:Protein of unknown function (DUF2934)